MLKRKFYNTLFEWKNSKHNDSTYKNTCLLVKGARQIGKTFIINLFCKENYKSYTYINFVETPEAKKIFDDELSAEEIYKRISLFNSKFNLIKNNSVIFLDEIQECPNARTALKFLAQDESCDVIASGSLLGISYKDVSSIPVGYECQKEMFGLDFEEFLWALGYEQTSIEILKSFFEKKEKVDDVIHSKMMKILREYITVGGMPAVVNSFIEENNFGKVQQMQEMILNSYIDDILKYASTTEKPKVRNCYLSIPKQLAKENKKFQFSVVEKKATSRKFENSVEWLRDAAFVRLCYNILTPNFPLSAYQKDNQYKMYLSDTGLLTALYGFEIKNEIINDTLKGPVKGGIYENLIADMLIKRGYKLNYFRSENGSIEIEFLISNNAKIIPIEVKSNNGQTLSLNKILEDDDVPFGYKFISGNIGMNEKKISLPLYMAMFL